MAGVLGGALLGAGLTYLRMRTPPRTAKGGAADETSPEGPIQEIPRAVSKRHAIQSFPDFFADTVFGQNVFKECARCWRTHACLRKLAAAYLRVDMQSLADQFEALVFTKGCPPDLALQVFARSDASSFRTSLRELVDVLEAAAHRYFGSNWDDPDGILAANSRWLEEDISGCAILQGKEPGEEDEREAVSLWMRARRAVDKERAVRYLGRQSKFRSLIEIFSLLRVDSDDGGAEGAREGVGEGARGGNLSSGDSIDEDGDLDRVVLSNEGLHFVASPQAALVDSTPRRPRVLFLAGGMGAGKTTIRQLVAQEPFWAKHGKGAVVIEADRFKESDPIYQSLKGRRAFSSDNHSISELVHSRSTAAAESLLVSAINDGRDVIYDSTLAWRPFMEQVVEMIRDTGRRYRMGKGWTGGAELEDYWEVDPCTSAPKGEGAPYLIELVGVFCDPGLAVARAMWRTMQTKRGVPVPRQLRSHAMFAANFSAYVPIVDTVALYDTGGPNAHIAPFCRNEGAQPTMVAFKCAEQTRGELRVVDSRFDEFSTIADINIHASGRKTLRSAAGGAGSREGVMSPGARGLSMDAGGRRLLEKMGVEVVGEVCLWPGAKVFREAQGNNVALQKWRGFFQDVPVDASGGARGREGGRVAAAAA